MNTVYFCLAVYNEEKNLEECIFSLDVAIKKIKNPIKTIICLNGCEDDSIGVAKKCKILFKSLNIMITKSKKGKLNAQKKMVSFIPLNSRIFFVDADTKVSKESISILSSELDKNKKLVAVGAFPKAMQYLGHNPWKMLMSSILNIRSMYPMSEISKLDVSEYHKLAINNPQKINTNKEHESKSKIFFHGRLFLLRSKKYWNMPSINKMVVGDDSYLPDYIIYNYGKNRIRIRYDAIVYFEPLVSLKNHYKTYHRIYCDLKNLKDNFPEFKDIRNHSVLILDNNYIKKQKFFVRVRFKLFIYLRNIEKLFYSLSNKKDPSNIWIKD